MYNGVINAFSQEQSFETAPAGLEGNWIGSGASVIRKTFILNQDISQVDRARAYMGSTSLIETRMNGQKVGDCELDQYLTEI